MDQTYSLKEVLSALGISRTTLLYYEKQGIVPVRKNPANGYRYFYHDDINVLKQCIWLKNLGYSITEVAGKIKEGGIFLPDSLQVYQEKLQQRINYDTAIREQLSLYEESLRREFGVVEYTETTPTYCVLFFGCEEGYHVIHQSEDSDRLIRQIPLSGFLLCFDDSFWEGKAHYKAGRCIQKKYISLAFPDGEKREWMEFGGRPALRMKTRMKDGELVREDVDRLKAYIDAEGYEVCGEVVSLYSFREEMEITVPVNKRKK